MNRLFFLLCACVLFFAACKTAPSSTQASSNGASPVESSSASVGLTRFGAGSVEEKSSQPVNKTEPVTASPAIRHDEILPQVQTHEADIDAALAARNYSAAFASYDSIVNLLSEIPAGLEKVKADREKIGKALDLVGFEAVSAPGETMAGVAFKKDFSVRVYTLEQGVKKPLSGFSCVVSWPSVDADGVKIISEQTLTTSPDGLATFTAPVPVKSGKDTLTISAALSSHDPVLLDSVNLRKEKEQLSSSFAYVVSTRARSIPTTISILDFDKNGKAISSSNLSATTLLAPLVKKGFSRIGMADFTAQLSSGDEVALLKAARALFGKAVQRFIYGTTRIDSLVQNSDGLWSCTVTARLTVRDFVNETTTYTATLSETATGKTEAAAISAARVKLAGEDLVQALFYNL